MLALEVFTEIWNTFDTVDHTLLLKKLTHNQGRKNFFLMVVGAMG